jgi:hypothetical protein
VRRGLTDIYRLYGETESMLEKVSRDAPLVEPMAAALDAFLAYVESAVEALLRGRPERGAARRRVGAAIRHAVAFPTWQSLIRAQGLDLTELAGRQEELLEAFRECQEGRCTCPTEEYRKVASVDVKAEEDRIAIRLESKPGERLDPSEINACLDHTMGKVDDSAQPTPG